MYPPIAPILPTGRKDLPPENDGWAWELKIDGDRGLADTINGRMLSKNLSPLKRFQHLLDAPPLDCVIDGEICVLDSDGRPQFNDSLFGRGDPVYVVFDLLFIRSLPLKERRAILDQVAVAVVVAFCMIVPFAFPPLAHFCYGRPPNLFPFPTLFPNPSTPHTSPLNL